MKKSLILTLVFVLSIGFVKSQIIAEDTVYYNKSWKKVDSRASSEYYRYVAEIDPENWKEFTYYTSNDQLKSELAMSSLNPRIYEGMELYYYRSGKIKSRKVTLHTTSYYENGQIKREYNGEADAWIEYYENGQKQSQIRYGHEGLDTECHFWDDEGNSILEDGIGRLLYLPDEDGDVYFIDYEYCKMKKSGYLIGGDSNSEILDQNASFPGGTEAYSKFLQKNLKYPTQARRKGVQGKVYVQFIVNQDGSLSDVKALKGIGAGCDTEAVRVISLSKAWVPGTQKDIPVKQRMIIPIVYKLSGLGERKKTKKKKGGR